MQWKEAVNKYLSRRKKVEKNEKGKMKKRNKGGRADVMGSRTEYLNPSFDSLKLGKL